MSIFIKFSASLFSDVGLNDALPFQKMRAASANRGSEIDDDFHSSFTLHKLRLEKESSLIEKLNIMVSEYLLGVLDLLKNLVQIMNRKAPARKMTMMMVLKFLLLRIFSLLCCNE